jgi:hypothetical protein
MSQGQWSQHGEPHEPLVWERVTWRQGDGRYVFEVAEGGLHGKLVSPHGTSLTLPMVAWEGLLDAISGARKTRTRNERGFPARSGARWYDGEAGELAAAFKSGRSVAQLARAHSRSEFAVEAQLDRMGLWDRVNGRPLAGGEADPRPQPVSKPGPHRHPGLEPRRPADGAPGADQGPASAAFGCGRDEEPA